MWLHYTLWCGFWQVACLRTNRIPLFRIRFLNTGNIILLTEKWEVVIKMSVILHLPVIFDMGQLACIILTGWVNFCHMNGITVCFVEIGFSVARIFLSQKITVHLWTTCIYFFITNGAKDQFLRMLFFSFSKYFLFPLPFVSLLWLQWWANKTISTCFTTLKNHFKKSILNKIVELLVNRERPVANKDVLARAS